jgi:hypothetical protein
MRGEFRVSNGKFQASMAKRLKVQGFRVQVEKARGNGVRYHEISRQGKGALS